MANLLKESKIIELKKSLDELPFALISVGAILNASNSCLLYFGIDHDGKAYGVKTNKDTLDFIKKEIDEHIFPRLDYEISLEKLERKEVIKIKANGNKRPYSVFKKYYIRDNNNDRYMSFNQLKEIILKNSNIYKNPNEFSFDYKLNQIDEKKLINFIEKINIKNNFDFSYKGMEDCLSKLGLIHNSLLSRSALFLFSNKNDLATNLNLYKNDDKSQLIISRQIRGDIFTLIDNAFEFIKENIKYLDSNKSIPEIPFQVLKEILLNMYMHQDYDLSFENQIDITPSYITFSNPGNIIKGLSPLDFALGIEESHFNNPLIALMLYLNQDITMFGQGFKTVFDISDKEGIKYQFMNKDNNFIFEFSRKAHLNKILVKEKNKDKPIKETIEISLSDIDKKVFDLIKTKEGLRKEDIAKKTNKSLITIQRSIKKLIDNHYIKRVGSNKTGYWVAIK